MEPYWLHENEVADEDRRIAVVGLGNPFHGDDGAGCVVARNICERLRQTREPELLESFATGFRLSEHLIGFRRAVIIDTLIDDQAPIGTVNRVEVLEGPGGQPVSLHSGGFHEGLALARSAGLVVPSTIHMYGIVIREAESFSETLSPDLQAKLPSIIQCIASAENRADS